MLEMMMMAMVLVLRGTRIKTLRKAFTLTTFIFHCIPFKSRCTIDDRTHNPRTILFTGKTVVMSNNVVMIITKKPSKTRASIFMVEFGVNDIMMGEN
jgi:hypothetical protein